jgi:hypothetical protein
MTDQERRVLAAQLWATRASVDAALVALGEMHNETTDVEDDGCTHPIELRQDQTTMGGPDGWRCRSCGFTTLSDPQPE